MVLSFNHSALWLQNEALKIFRRRSRTTYKTCIVSIKKR
ncbi:CRPV-275 [Crowpox virus]|nr:CRPV-275 [Crowpox virus]